MVNNQELLGKEVLPDRHPSQKFCLRFLYTMEPRSPIRYSVFPSISGFCFKNIFKIAIFKMMASSNFERDTRAQRL